MSGKGRYFEDFSVGDSFTSVGRTVMESDIVQFLNLSRNLEPQFSNREFYEKEWVFKRLASPGGLTFTFLTGLFTHIGILTGTGEGFLGADELRMPAPLFCGDTMFLEVKVVETRLSSKGRGIVSMALTATNQDGDPVLTCKQSYFVALKPEA